MSTISLRKDHDLIEKVLKSMWATVTLLKDGKSIPESILLPVIDFTKNFTDVCHHGKEENSLFPELEKKGMPRNAGPIAVMLMEHEITRNLSHRIEESLQVYLKTADSTQLVTDMTEYINHVMQHLWKENNRLFMMADMALQDKMSEVNQNLSQMEESKLKEIGKSRVEYEKLADDLDKKISMLS
jgi:hemerythrin-like domain-containing protein